jgi:hypothetical protein
MHGNINNFERAPQRSTNRDFNSAFASAIIEKSQHDERSGVETLEPASRNSNQERMREDIYKSDDWRDLGGEVIALDCPQA